MHKCKLCLNNCKCGTWKIETHLIFENLNSTLILITIILFSKIGMKQNENIQTKLALRISNVNWGK
jgi:hypothetical protein